MSSVAVSSYAACAVAFAALALAIQLGKTSRGQWRLASCAGATALWAFVSAYHAIAPLPAVVEPAETLRTMFWLSYLLQLFSAHRRIEKVLGLLAVAALSACGAWGETRHAAAAGMYLSMIRLLLSVAGMLLVERLYRDCSAGARWSAKFACMGIGALFAYDFFLYSDAVLFRQANTDIWTARGLVNALSAPLIGIAVLRSPVPAPALMLSRRLLLGSVALIGSAVYLLVMAASAWYLRFIGGAWGPLMQVVCLFGALLLLAAVLFSGAARASMKVLIGKHFFQGRFDYREEWLRLTRTLSNGAGELSLTIVQAMAALVESPAGALWTKGEGGSFIPSAHWNMAPPPIIGPMGNAWCRFIEDRHWVIDVPEYVRHPQRYAGLALPGWLCEQRGIWLLVPLMLHGQLFGVLCLAQSRSALRLNWELIDVLKIAGSQAASYLAYRQSADSLSIARRFESLNQLSAFVVHDLKNMVSQLSLLLANAEKHHADPAFQADMLETVAHSLEKMKQLLLRLGQQGGVERACPVSLHGVLERTVARLAMLKPAPVLAMCSEGVTVLAAAPRLERVLGHLIQNGVEAAPDGHVEVSLRRQGEMAEISVRDSGAGMSEQFVREQLFKPFVSTKTEGMGIGMYESRAYVLELGGRLEVRSKPGKGTTFRILLPLHGRKDHG